MDFDHAGEGSGSGGLETISLELVARTLRDIDGRSAADREVLLRALFCAAWPTAAAQRQ